MSKFPAAGASRMGYGTMRPSWLRASCSLSLVAPKASCLRRKKTRNSSTGPHHRPTPSLHPPPTHRSDPTPLPAHTHSPAALPPSSPQPLPPHHHHNLPRSRSRFPEQTAASADRRRAIPRTTTSRRRTRQASVPKHELKRKQIETDARGAGAAAKPRHPTGLNACSTKTNRE